MGLCVSLQTSLNFHPFYTCSFLLNVIFLFQDHMPPRRVLISGSVLSLQDPCVLYPCCQNCVSRLFINKSGCICKKCGFICGVDDVKYRYRLSFGVARNSDIFGVAVFGSCLDPYFGVSAGFLHRFMEDLKKDAGDMVHTLLIQAVKDCFVGRHFIFGIKLSSVQSRKHSSFGEGLVQTSCSQYSATWGPYSCGARCHCGVKQLGMFIGTQWAIMYTMEQWRKCHRTLAAISWNNHFIRRRTQPRLKRPFRMGQEVSRIPQIPVHFKVFQWCIPSACVFTLFYPIQR
nr:PREDICTED: DNA damage-induced apoptosis suppressor protein isoform X3 [Lepisosteus oculatus]